MSVSPPAVSFGPIPVSEGETFDLSNAQNPLNVDWDANPYELYTVAFYDLSVPTPDNPYNSPFVHFLETNILGKDFSKGDLSIGYLAPHLPVGSKPHLYVVDVYSQPNKVYATIADRNRYDPVELANSNNLALERRITFYVKPEGAAPMAEPKKAWIQEGSPMTDQQQSFCRCVLDVAGKQPVQCNIEEAWFQKRGGKTCYNPYAVCSKSVGTTSRECGMWYNFDVIPNDELMGYASLNRIPIPIPFDREQMLKNIATWKEQKM